VVGEGWHREVPPYPDQQILSGTAACDPLPTIVSLNGNDGPCPLAVIRALAACTFKTRALTDFALFNHLIRAGAAVAGYAGPETADFPVKLVLGYIGID
jgi:hypothetical protein